MLEEFSQNFLEGDWETPVQCQSLWSMYWAGLESVISRIEGRTPHFYTFAISISSELKIAGPSGRAV